MNSSPVVIEPLLQKELRPDEHVLWWSRPDPKHRVHNGTSRRTFYRINGAIVMMMLLCMVIAFVLLPYTLNTMFYVAFLLLVSFIICLFVAIYSAVRIFVVYRDARKRDTSLRNTIYAITNKRVLVITSGKSFGVKSHTKEDIGQITRLESGGGWGDVTYGIARPVQVGQRAVVVADKLSGIPNVREVEDILLKTFKST